MLTYNRLEYAKASIDCFLSQTYENKELIVYNSGSQLYKTQLNDYIASQESDKIKHIYAHKKQSDTIGDIRNGSIKNASGFYLCTWDDDDLFSRQRIESQVYFLEKFNADFCMFTNFVIRLPNKDRYNVSYERGFEPSLIFKANDLSYPSLNKGEDCFFIKELEKKYKKVLVDNDFNDYIYTSNKNNVSGEQHFLGIIKRHKSRKI